MTAQTASRRDMSDATVMHAEVVEAMIERNASNEEELVYCKNILCNVFVHSYSSLLTPDSPPPHVQARVRAAVGHLLEVAPRLYPAAKKGHKQDGDLIDGVPRLLPIVEVDEAETGNTTGEAKNNEPSDGYYTISKIQDESGARDEEFKTGLLHYSCNTL